MHPMITHPHEPNERTSPAGRWGRPQSVLPIGRQMVQASHLLVWTVDTLLGGQQVLLTVNAVTQQILRTRDEAPKPEELVLRTS